jgi:hypothetical protein
MAYQSDRKRKLVNAKNQTPETPLEEFAGREMPSFEAVFAENGTKVVECG